MTRIIICCMLLCSAAVASSAEEPKNAAGLQYGEPVDWMQCALEASKDTVPEGAEPVFYLHLKFDKLHADRDIMFINRYLDARRVTVTFTNTETGESFRRKPDDGTSGVDPAMVKDDLVTTGMQFKPIELHVPLVNFENEHIMPGDYKVIATYENDAKPDVDLYKSRDELYDGPWRFWKGTIISAPISLDITLPDVMETELEVNPGIKANVLGAGIGWGWQTGNPKKISVYRCADTILGKRYQIHVYLDGKLVPYAGRGLSSRIWHDDENVALLPERIAVRIKQGTVLKLLAEVEVFETTVKPSEEGWNPLEGDFRTLWKGTFEGKLDEELQKTFSSLGDAL